MLPSKISIVVCILVVVLMISNAVLVHNSNRFLKRQELCLNMIQDNFKSTLPMIKDENSDAYLQLSLQEIKECVKVAE